MNVALLDDLFVLITKFPIGRVVDDVPSFFDLRNVRLQSVMIHGHQDIDHRLRAPDLLMTDVQLITGMSSFNKGVVLAIAEDAVTGTLETLPYNLTDRVDPLPLRADDFY